MTIEKGTCLKSKTFTILNTVGKNLQIRQFKREIKFIAYGNLLQNVLNRIARFECFKKFKYPKKTKWYVTA